MLFFKKSNTLLITVITLWVCQTVQKAKAQPYADIIAVNSYFLKGAYSDSSKNVNSLQNYYLNLLLPKKFGDGHIFMVRVNAEQLQVKRENEAKHTLSSISVPIGLQLMSKSEKWKYLGLFIPKVNSDFEDDLKHDFQFGGAFLATRVVNPNLSIKIGAYYMAEFFGPFYFPLIGVDWKVNEKFRMYGTLPSFYRIEYQPLKKLYTGIGFRMNQRSFRLQGKYNNDFIRIKDNQLNWFIEGFVFDKIILGMQVYRTITYSMLRYDKINRNTEKLGINTFTPTDNAWGLNFNLSYRFRTD